VPTPHAQRTPVNGNLRMTDWSKKQLGPLPPAMRDGRMNLGDIIGADGAREIQDDGEIRIHVLGDSGVPFYTPYRHYPGKIVAIPGNHDGEVKTPIDGPSLSAFQANFCAATAEVSPQAAGSGIFRRP
jgi:hypothetical protein